MWAYRSTGLRAAWSACEGVSPSPARSGHTACAATDGSLYLFGGYAEVQGERDVVNDLWRWRGGVWECVQPASDRSDRSRPGPRLCSASAIVGDQLFLFGGWDPEVAGSGGSILDDVWCLRLGTMEWERLADSMPRGPTSRHVACVADTQDGPRVIIHTFRCATSVVVFDPESRKATEVPTSGPAPSSRGLHAAAASGSKMFVFGGAAKDGQMMNDVHVLDTQAWTWSLPMVHEGASPGPRAGAAASATAIEGTFVVYGGAERADGGGLQGRGDAWALQLLGDTEAAWELLLSENDASAPPGRNAHTLTKVGAVGTTTQLLLHGGWQPFVRTFEDTHELYVHDDSR